MSVPSCGVTRTDLIVLGVIVAALVVILAAQHAGWIA